MQLCIPRGSGAAVTPSPAFLGHAVWPSATLASSRELRTEAEFHACSTYAGASEISFVPRFAPTIIWECVGYWYVLIASLVREFVSLCESYRGPVLFMACP
jgi:hypothetical protein